MEPQWRAKEEQEKWQNKISAYLVITDVKRAFEASKVFLSQGSAQTRGIYSVFRKAGAQFVLQKSHFRNRDKALSVSLFSCSEVGYCTNINC